MLDPFPGLNLLRDLLAYKILDLFKREILLGNRRAADDRGVDVVGPILILFPSQVLDALTQIVAVGALLAVHEGDLVEAIVRSVADHALEAERDPGLGVRDEGGRRNTILVSQHEHLVAELRSFHLKLVIRTLSIKALTKSPPLLLISALKQSFALTQSLTRVPRLGNPRLKFFELGLNLRDPLHVGGLNKPFLLPLLPPVALDLLDEQNLLALGIRARVEADVGEDIGLVPVGGNEVTLTRVLPTERLIVSDDPLCDLPIHISRIAAPPISGYSIPHRKGFPLWVREGPLFTCRCRGSRSARQRQQQFPVVGAAGELVVGVAGGVKSAGRGFEVLRHLAHLLREAEPFLSLGGIPLALPLLRGALCHIGLLDPPSRILRRRPTVYVASQFRRHLSCATLHRLLNLHPALLKEVLDLLHGDLSLGLLLQVQPLLNA